jgi:hypothetical protein
MPAAMLDSLLTACGVTGAQREIWHHARARARARAEFAASGLTRFQQPAMHVVRDNVTVMPRAIRLDTLVTELRMLRKGGGVLTIAMHAVGEALHTACGLEHHASDPAAARAHLIAPSPSPWSSPAIGASTWNTVRRTSPPSTAGHANNFLSGVYSA